MSQSTHVSFPTVRGAGLAVLLAVGATACSGASGAPEPEGPAVLTLSSPDRADDGTLPEWATATVMSFCAGENRSPRLEWAGVPEGTASFALTLVDATNPDYVHWVVTGIDAPARAVESAADGAVAEGTVGWNFLAPGVYRGPCAVDHTYSFTLYALDDEIEGSERTTHDDLIELVDGHVLATATLDVRPAAADRSAAG